ncbi:hypothetical protein ABER23_04000 [Paenibacillus lautus]|uniref:hypothetical protein n=1 Tax=Paenibacillus lautus TaxID=1401 RepID=UPI003D28BD6E
MANKNRVLGIRRGSNQVRLEGEQTIPEQQPELNNGKEERPLTIEDIVKPGKFGVTNSQMIPAIKQVIADGSVEKLRMLRSIYLYSFENSLRYLKKSEREFIQNNLK